MRANKNFLRLNIFKVQLKQELFSFIIRFKVNGSVQSTESMSGKSLNMDKSYFFEIDTSGQEVVVELSVVSKKLYFIESEVACSTININFSKQSEETKAWYSVTNKVNDDVVMQALLSFSSDFKQKHKILSSNYNTESSKPKISIKADLSYDRVFTNSTKKANLLIKSKTIKSTTNMVTQDESLSQESLKEKNEDQSSLIEHDSRELVKRQLNKTSSASHNFVELDDMGNLKKKSNKSIVLHNISSDETDQHQQSVLFAGTEFDQSKILPNDFGNLSTLFDTSLLPASDNILNTTVANMSSNSLFMSNSILNNTLIPSNGIELIKKLKKKYIQISQEKDILLKVSSDVSRNKESKCK